MSTKLCVTGPDFLELLEKHPELELEIVKGSRAVIVQALAKKMVNQLSKKISIDVEKKAKSNEGWRFVPSPWLKKTVKAELQVKFADSINQLVNDSWHELRKTVREELVKKEEKLKEIVEEELKQLSLDHLNDYIKKYVRDITPDIVGAEVRTRLGIE